mgnify:CR=1 FL=1
MASYNLVDCAGILPDVRIEWNGVAPMVETSSYVFSFNLNTCWTPEFIPAQTGLPGYTDVDVTEFTDCNECNAVCYRIIDCDGGDDVITSDDAIKGYVGKVIKWQDDLSVERCGQVVTYLCREEPPGTPVITIIECHENCTDCKAVTNVIAETFTVTPRVVKPKYELPLCKPEFYEKTQCNFSEAIYQEVISKRYGIEFCCNEDKEKWEIKKYLIDSQLTSARFDPDAFTEGGDGTGLVPCEGYGIGVMSINDDSCRVFRVTPIDEIL